MTEFNIEVLTEDIQKHSEFVDTLKLNLHNTIVGQNDLIEKLIIAILSDGHVFLEGVPGLAKTLTVKTLASLIATKFQRIQFTPDLLPADLINLEAGAQRYSFLTSDSGGILDDLMVYRLEDEYCLVVNAANKEADLSLLQERLTTGVFVDPRQDFALLALQGPQAAAALESIAPAVKHLTFMTASEIRIAGIECCVTRSGYTGEDGFEISTHETSALDLASVLLALDSVEPSGLGARDTLRLEAGLCLHGNDIGPRTSPVEAGLSWAIPASRRSGGVRAGAFPGAERILKEIEHGPSQKRVGIRPIGKAPVRAHAPLLAPNNTLVGEVTSGGFGPSVGAPIAMAYLPSTFAEPGTTLEAQVRNKALPVTVCRLPFVPHRYHQKTKEKRRND